MNEQFTLMRFCPCCQKVTEHRYFVGKTSKDSPYYHVQECLECNNRIISPFTENKG